MIKSGLVPFLYSRHDDTVSIHVPGSGAGSYGYRIDDITHAQFSEVERMFDIGAFNLSAVTLINRISASRGFKIGGRRFLLIFLPVEKADAFVDEIFSFPRETIDIEEA